MLETILILFVVLLAAISLIWRLRRSLNSPGQCDGCSGCRNKTDSPPCDSNNQEK